ncbi:MAG: primosomal protein N' [Trueperaceae bacterium]|nr:primosomal protein N' [Trueperaceae bacterium]
MPTAVSVLLPLPLPAFSYLLPFEQEKPVLGARVVVPWQAGVRTGIVVKLEEIPATKALELKELIYPLDYEPFILPELLSFIENLAKTSISPPGQILATLLPTGLNETLIHEVKAIAGTQLELNLEDWSGVEKLSPGQLDFLRKQGLILERVRIEEAKLRVLIPYKKPDEKLKTKAKANQLQALEWLWEVETVESGAELARQADVPESSVRTLVKNGYAGYEEITAPPPVLPSYVPKTLPLTKLYASENHRAVTGGYRAERLAALIPILQGDLKRGKSVMVIVPEQFILEETASYLQGLMPLQVLSGELTDAQRKRFWQELSQHEPLILVGTYLAMLAPLRQLGRIVILEEASSSYKLQSGPRLFVSSSLRHLAQHLTIPVMLSDSLLSPEGLSHVGEAQCLYLPSPERRLHVADLSQQTNWPLSSELIQVLKQVQERDRRAILLAPRRGFSAALGCSDCTWLAECPNCDLSLRYHQDKRQLSCHQCGYSTAIPLECPNCHNVNLGAMRGAGTQWIAKEVSKHLPGFPIYRYDADERDTLSPLLEGEAGVVIGTTALLRHAPLPDVSLIGLTLFDTLLGVSDFRAEEETLRLWLQLAELSPQARPLTLIQTFQSQHPLLEFMAAKDAEKAMKFFLEGVLERRKRFHYPPFAEVAKIQVSAKQEMTAQREANWLADALKLHVKDKGEVVGPSAAPVTKLKGLYSYQLFVRDLAHKGFETLLQPVQAYARGARVRVDVDPRDIGRFLD